jgi:hypothetical protein
MTLDLVVVAKALAWVAFAITGAGYLRGNDRQLKQAIATSSGLLSMHFMLMSAWVPAANLFVNAVRNHLSRSVSGMGWFLGFSTLQIGMSIACWSQPRDFFPLAGSLMSGYALLCCHGRSLRFWMLLCGLLWLINDALLRTYGAVMQDLFGISANLYGLYRQRDQRD